MCVYIACILSFSKQKTLTHHKYNKLMDWFSWLSKTSLDPSLVYEYSLAFSHNELEEDDLYYLNHEFLQSMGISIAKHRLEILKLARKDSNNFPRPVSRLVFAIKKTKKTFVKYIRTLVRKDESSLMLVSKRSLSSRLGGAMLKRKSKRYGSNLGTKLFLTNGNSPLDMAGLRIGSFSNPMMYDISNDDKLDDYDDPYWSTGVEEIKWDAMFQDLKPT